MIEIFPRKFSIKGRNLFLIVFDVAYNITFPCFKASPFRFFLLGEKSAKKNCQPLSEASPCFILLSAKFCKNGKPFLSLRLPLGGKLSTKLTDEGQQQKRIAIFKQKGIFNLKKAVKKPPQTFRLTAAKRSKKKLFGYLRQSNGFFRIIERHRNHRRIIGFFIARIHYAIYFFHLFIGIEFNFYVLHKNFRALHPR